MTAPRSPGTAASVAQAVDTRDATTTDGDTVVLALPNAPAIRRVHRPHAQGSRQTAGRRGLPLARRWRAGRRAGAGATTGYCPGRGPKSNISKRSPIAGML